MQTTEPMASEAGSDWPRWAGEKIATILAVIGLADLFSKQVAWSPAIRWVIGDYRTATAWLFGWLPSPVSSDWQDYILLSGILFAVTAAAHYKHILRAHRAYVVEFMRVVAGAIAGAVLLWPAKLSGRMAELRTRMTRPAGDFVDKTFWISCAAWLSAIVLVGIVIADYSLAFGAGGTLVAFLMLPFVFVVAMYAFACALIALPWVISTAQLFVVLVAVNAIDVYWLTPIFG